MANLHLSIIIQIFGVENEPGVPKVGFWNPVTQRIELYNDELFKLTSKNLTM